jgi:hypothetical protein
MRTSVSRFEGWPRIKPWSCRSFAMALLLVSTSCALQTLAEIIGVHLEFAAFLPAVFVAGFLGGKPAGAFAAILALPLVWWAFLPPAFEFSRLTADGYDAIKLFFLGSVLLVYCSDLCRDICFADFAAARTVKRRSILEIIEARPATAQAAEPGPVRAVDEPMPAGIPASTPAIGSSRRKRDRKRRRRDLVERGRARSS